MLLMLEFNLKEKKIEELLLLDIKMNKMLAKLRNISIIHIFSYLRYLLNLRNLKRKPKIKNGLKIR
jgi:hypothetical protein